MEQSVRAKVLTEQAQISSSTEELIGKPATRYSIKKKALNKQEPPDSPDQETMSTGTTENRQAVSFLFYLKTHYSHGVHLYYAESSPHTQCNRTLLPLLV